MKKLFVILILCPLLSIAQKEDRVWVFEDSVGIDWNDTLNPLVYKIDMNFTWQAENYASLANKNGVLLYYVGQGSLYQGNLGLFSAIYGLNEKIIPFGDSICSNRSETQGMLFIPFINDTNKYYLFYIGDDITSFGVAGFNYAIIDKSLGAYGKCISKVNTLALGYFTEKLTAVRHGNGLDWWILIHKYNTNEFYKFLVTSNGISGPIIQSIGPTLQSQGQMKFSVDGSKLGLVETYNDNTALFDFNRCTGELSNYIDLGNENNIYGCSFSPNNRIFYASSKNKLFQFNLDSPNVAQSKIQLWDDSTNWYIVQHLLAPDGKIYIASGPPTLPSQAYTFRNKNLTVIENPNVYGVGCNIQPYSFYLNGMRCMGGLPNMVNYNLGALIGSPCDTIVTCLANQQTINTSVCEGEVFNFNGTVLTATGNYYDTLLNSGGCDSVISLQLTVISNTSSSSTASICNGESYNFNGSTLTAAGVYVDTVLNVGGCDSVISLLLTVISNTSSASTASICSGESYNFNGTLLTTAGIYADTVLNVAGCDSVISLLLTVISNTSSASTASICSGESYNFNGSTLTAAGVYADTVLNVNGCDSLISLLLTVISSTSSSNTASICNGESYNFNGTLLTAAGDYIDTLTNSLACDSIIYLELTVLNNTSSSSTQKICEGDSVLIGINIYYNDGTYIDTLINSNGCDSIITTTIEVDSVTAGITTNADTLTATGSGSVNYQWYNCDSSTNITGATNQTFVATTTGNYAVIITDAQGCTKQSECVFVLVSSVNGELSIVNGFIIYPNPTDGQLTVYSEQLTVSNIQIVDVLGRVERLLRTDYSSRNDIFTIDVSGLSSGVYFVKVKMIDGSFGVKKFVKE